MPEGLCHNRLCRQPVVTSPRYRNTKFCVSCTIDREIAARKKKEERLRRCKHCPKRFHAEKPWEKFCSVACKKEFMAEAKKGAIQRKHERRARRRLRKRNVEAYPRSGFAEARKQLSLFEVAKCEITGTTEKEHVKLHKCGLHMDHIIPARIAAEAGKNPHAPVNLMWLSNTSHGQKKAAEEQLKGKGGMYGFVLKLKQDNWPMERVKAALEFYGLWSDRLPL